MSGVTILYPGHRDIHYDVIFVDDTMIRIMRYDIDADGWWRLKGCEETHLVVIWGLLSQPDDDRERLGIV